MVLQAVFTLMSSPSERAIGTMEYPFFTVVWLPMNLSMNIMQYILRSDDRYGSIQLKGTFLR